MAGEKQLEARQPRITAGTKEKRETKEKRQKDRLKNTLKGKSNLFAEFISVPL